MTQALRPASHVLARILALLAMAAVGGCRTDRANPSGPAPSMTSGSSAQAALAPDAGPPPRDAGGTSDPRNAWPRLAPLLDEARGARALAAYRALLAKPCHALDGGSAAGSLEQKGIRLPAADLDTLCLDASAAGRPFASGSFVQPGADEVLLEVPSGLSTATGNTALALMRSDDAGYRFVKHMVLGKGFGAKARLTTTADRDVLLLCQQHGSMGLYPSTCGFFGRGTFRDRTAANADPGNAAKNELRLGVVTLCGPGASVTLGEITLHDDILRVELIVEHFVLEKDRTDEPADFCSRKVPKSRKQLDVEYRFDGASFQRATPMPREVEAALHGY